MSLNVLARGAELATVVSTSDPGHGECCEQNAALQVRRLDVAATPDAMTEPARSLVGGVGQQQQHQGRGAEDNQRPKLVLKRQRHVGDQDDRQQKHAVDRPVVAEDVVGGRLGGPPDQNPEDQAEVADLKVDTWWRQVRSR